MPAYRKRWRGWAFFPGIVWKMTRRWLGKWPAALTAVLFIFFPPVLANAGIATTDMPFLAAFLPALDGIWIALREPKGWNYVCAGAGAGLACSAKMSGQPFCFLCAAIFAAYLWWIGRAHARLFPRALARSCRGLAQCW